VTLVLALCQTAATLRKMWGCRNRAPPVPPNVEAGRCPKPPGGAFGAAELDAETGSRAWRMTRYPTRDPRRILAARHANLPKEVRWSLLKLESDEVT
jgi:hypothetical protein